MKPQELSEPMRAVLGMLDSQGAVPVYQLHIQLYDLTTHVTRRSADASLSRTLRRLEKRGLISRNGDTVVITQCGRWAIHPEEYQQFLEQFRQSVGEAVKQAIAECPELQQANREAIESEARWQEIFKANGWR